MLNPGGFLISYKWLSMGMFESEKSVDGSRSRSFPRKDADEEKVGRISKIVQT